MLEALAALAKLLLYTGLLVSAGTAFAAASLGHRLGATMSLAPPIIHASAAAAILGAVGHVYVLIERLGGDFSAPVLAAVQESPTGTALVLQLAGSLWLIIFASPWGIRNYVCVVGGALAIGSFGINGHAGSLNAMSGVIAAMHVGAAAWWLGALLLLRPASDRLGVSDFVSLIRKFSIQALILVAGLVVAGTFLVLSLLNFSRQDWFTPYAQLLSLKIALAGSVLGLAAFNKLGLTPRICEEDGRATRALRRSITFEIAIIGAILAATALLTTYTSPHT
jgi:putative copper resistance protein D